MPSAPLIWKSSFQRSAARSLPGSQESVQHGEEDRPFQGKAPWASSHLALYRLLDPQLLPQAIEDQGWTDGQRAVRLDSTLAVGIDDRANRRELRQRSGEVVDLA